MGRKDPCHRPQGWNRTRAHRARGPGEQGSSSACGTSHLRPQGHDGGRKGIQAQPMMDMHSR